MRIRKRGRVRDKTHREKQKQIPLYTDPEIWARGA